MQEISNLPISRLLSSFYRMGFNAFKILSFQRSKLGVTALEKPILLALIVGFSLTYGLRHAMQFPDAQVVFLFFKIIAWVSFAFCLGFIFKLENFLGAFLIGYTAVEVLAFAALGFGLMSSYIHWFLELWRFAALGWLLYPAAEPDLLIFQKHFQEKVATRRRVKLESLPTAATAKSVEGAVITAEAAAPLSLEGQRVMAAIPLKSGGPL